MSASKAQIAIYFSDILTNSVAGSVIALAIACLYIVSRIGLSIPWTAVSAIVGLTLFLLNAPIQLASYFKTSMTSSYVYVGYSLAILLLLATVCLGGWIVGYSPIIAVSISVLGGLLFLINIRKWFQFDVGTYAIVVTWVLLGLWLGASIWTQGSLNPFIWEKMLDLTVHPETLFHATITNMLRYYQISSTGLDGLPKLHYHYGSHIVFAAVSKLLNVPTITLYELGHPVLFFPLFTVGIINAAVLLRNFFKTLVIIPLRVDWTLWLILVLGIVGVVPASILYKVGMPPLLFFSESYLVSMSLTWLVLPLSFPPFTKVIKLNFVSIGTLFFAILGILFIGLTKISTLYFILVVGGYGLMRTKKNQVLLACCLFVLIAGSWLVYQEALFSEHAGGLFFFHYFVQVITLKWFPLWLLLGIGATWLYIAFAFMQSHMSNQPFHLSKDLELVILITIIGLVPTLLIDLGPNGNYFVDMVRWVVFILLLAQSQALQKVLEKSIAVFISKRVSWVLFLIAASLLASFLNNFLSPFEKLATARENITEGSGNPKRAIVLEQLRDLSQKQHDPNTILYIPPDSAFWFDQAQCNDSAFIATSLTGYPLLQGMPAEGCDRDRYAYILYSQRPKLPKIIQSDQLCQHALDKGFNTILVVHDNLDQLHCLEVL